MMNNFIGKDGFVWWLGIVEDRDDPLHLGRVRVRMFGHHTDNLQELPKEALSWAIPCMTPNNTMLDGTPLIGDYAFGFFTDGLNGQAPVILGIFPGIPTKGANPSKGFSEGTHYPVGEPTTSRLFRNEKIGQTVIGQHNSNLDQNVPTASGDTWSEPKSAYNTKPPLNRVLETESGHVLEMDDTPGSERVHLAHRANTFFEIAPDGSKVTKVSGKNYEIYLSDNNVHIKGVCNITVDGNTNLYVKGDTIQKNDGSFTGTASSFTFNGNMQVNGSINATGDVVGAGISLDNHVHGGVKAGGDTTSPPQ